MHAGRCKLEDFEVVRNLPEKKSVQVLNLGILCLFVFVVIFLTTDPILPLYIDLGRYDTTRVVVMIFPLIGVLVFCRLHRR